MRLLGVSLSSLSKGEDQLPLFQQPDNGKKEALAKAVDQVNDKFGEHTVTYGSMLTQEKGQRVISPAWRPSGVRKSDVQALFDDASIGDAVATTRSEFSILTYKYEEGCREKENGCQGSLGESYLAIYRPLRPSPRG